MEEAMTQPDNPWPERVTPAESWKDPVMGNMLPAPGIFSCQGPAPKGLIVMTGSSRRRLPSMPTFIVRAAEFAAHEDDETEKSSWALM
jgi:hypothetical protein